MLPRDVWDAVIEIFFNEEHKKIRNEICHIAYYQFCMNEFILSDELCNIPYKLLHGKKYEYDCDIFLPHENLDFALDKYEKNSPPSKEIYAQYKKSKILFEKIISVENDEEKWIEALKETGDDLFVQQNVEFRLGKDLSNKKLWKCYIAYLKEYNPTIMLHTYSKYCRFWLDDLEMKKEYEEQVKIHGQICVPWTNVFYPQNEKTLITRILKNFSWLHLPLHQPQFEKTCFISEIILFCYPRITIFRNPSWSYQNFRDLRVLEEYPKVYYTKNGLIYQKFAFRRTVINYILKHANTRVLQKLFKSCKEFFSKQPTPVCYNLNLYMSNNDDYKAVTFLEESMKIIRVNPETLFPGKKFIIRNRINNSQNLSSFIPKIYKCEAKFIELYSQQISAKDFEVLTESGCVEEIIFEEVNILCEDGTFLPMERVMKRLLNIRRVEIYFASDTFYTLQTAQVLSEISFKNKIQYFTIWHVNVQLDPDLFAKFIQKNAASNCKLKIIGPIFEGSLNFPYRKKFYDKIQETIETKWKYPHKPKFRIKAYGSPF